MIYTRDQIEESIKQLDYKYFKTGNYNLNIIGIRNALSKNKVTNKFDDTMTLSYKNAAGVWQFHTFDCTTDPGTHWVENTLSDKGVAILKPGQYRSSHIIRKHQGRYEALGQHKPVKVYRDNNRDHNYDLDEKTIEEGIFGINIHRATKYAGKKSTQIDKWSAGCQVIASNDDWKLFMSICRKARVEWGNSFTYTLLDSNQIITSWL
tara:strand:+ start:1542 stop:2162 length:621 start_codon:yes stop_codon:yes gene_type:complete